MAYDLKIFTENIEPVAGNQIYNLLSLPPFADSKVRIMPDVHLGSGCVGDASRPYRKPRTKGLHPSGHPVYFPRKWYLNCKMQFDNRPTDTKQCNRYDQNLL